MTGVSPTSTWEAWLQFQNGFSRFSSSIIDACAIWTRWRLMRYPVNKTSITTSRNCYSVVFLRQARRLERERGAGLKNTHPALLCQVHCHPHRARRKWRKVVTGDPNKRIRDHMREVPQVCRFFFFERMYLSYLSYLVKPVSFRLNFTTRSLSHLVSSAFVAQR